MTAPRRNLLGSQAALLIAVTTPLAIGENVWIYWGLSLAASILGWLFVVRRGQALLGPKSARAVIVIAFIFLVIEYYMFEAIPVIAISHFMILVCVFRLLSRQSLADQAQVFVLCLLLLIIASIVSGNILFPAVLFVYLVVGIKALIRLHLAQEQHRITFYNSRICHTSAQQTSHTSHISSVSMFGVSSYTALASLLIGAAIFMFFPRIGAGMFGPTSIVSGGQSITGFDATLNFKKIGRIQVSDRPAMTVKIEDDTGQRITINPANLYFRGAAFDQYYRRNLGPRGSWEWRNAADSVNPLKQLTRRLPKSPGGVYYPFSVFQTETHTPMLVQKYWLEPCNHHYLFTLYPALEITPHNFRRIHKQIDNQVIKVGHKPSGILRYEVISPAYISPRLIESLTKDRLRAAEPETTEHTTSSPTHMDAEPTIFLPDPQLPREKEIRALLATIDDKANTTGDLDEPDKRQRFIKTTQAYLRSPEFSYTLQRPPVHGRDEPIGKFLFDQKRGHCEYFASALTLLCQLRGIPARVVTGYRGGDYNNLGNYYTVREKHAHAWVEAFIPGREWVAFDPTPGHLEQSIVGRRWLLGIYKYLDYLQFQWVNLVVTYDSNSRQDLLSGFENWLRRPAGQEETVLGATAAFIRELFLWRAKFSFYDRLLYWVFTIMVLALIILNGYVIAVLSTRAIASIIRWWRSKPSPVYAGEAEFYHRFCRRLAKLGLRRRTDQTPAEFADELAREFKFLKEAPSLIKAYYDVVFGRRKLSSARISSIEIFLRRLRSIDREQLHAKT